MDLTLYSPTISRSTDHPNTGTASLEYLPMATLVHTPGSIEISAERPVPVQTRDVKSPSGDVESSVTNPLTCSEELPSVEIYVEILGDSDDDDSEDGSDDEEVKNFLVRIIKMTLASEKQAEDPDLPQAPAENQQSEGGMSFLVMLAPCGDTDTLDEDSGEPVSTLNEMPQDRVARQSSVNKSSATESNEGCAAPPSTAIPAGGF